MKKFLGIVGAASLIASTTTTVVACWQTQKVHKKDYSRYNNSLANLEGSSSVLAKQLIMSDQYGISFRDLSQAVGDIQAQSEIKQNTGLNFNTKDFNLNADSDISDLTNQYFGNLKLESINKIGDINLNGTLGTKNGQLWKMLKNKLGVDLGDNIVAIIDGVVGQMLPNLTGFSLFEEIIKNLAPAIDKSIGDLIKGKKQTIELISIAAKILFTNEKLMAKWFEKLDAFDVCAIYPDLQAESFLGAGLISLSNAIGLLIQNNSEKGYQETILTSEESKDPKVVTQKLLTAGSNFGEVIAGLIKTDSGSETQSGFSANNFSTTLNNDIEKNIDKYLGVATGFFQFLQLIQLQFSLFDEAKNFVPTETKKDNYLFSNEKTNKEYIKETMLGVDGKGRTIRQIKNIAEGKNVEGTLNLKYLFSIFKGAFSPTANPEEKTGTN